MPKKGQMSDQDAADELVRRNATHYNVVLHVPQRNSRVRHSTESLSDAIEYAETVFDDPLQPGVRAAMIYAVDEHDRFALMGTTNRFNRTYKPNKVKIY
jgi:hypothetical protein